jgi:hypothetical protein
LIVLKKCEMFVCDFCESFFEKKIVSVKCENVLFRLSLSW